MLNDRPSNTAEMFRMLDRRVTRLETKDRTDAQVRITRQITDTEISSDTVSATTEPVDAGFIIGQDNVGRGFL